MIASKSTWIALVVLAAVPTTALPAMAQPAASPPAAPVSPEPAPMSPVSPVSPEPVSAEPVSPTVDEAATTPVAAPPSEVADAPVADRTDAAPATAGRGPSVAPRPDGFSIGSASATCSLPQLDAPNIVSARLRINSRFTLEPRLELSEDSSSVEVDGTEVSDTTSTYAVGASLRTTVARRGRGDLIVVGGAAVEHVESDPDGDFNTTTLTRFAIDWGLAIDTWLTPSLAVSATATNPVLVASEQTIESDFDDRTSSATAVALAWDPRLAVMVHLFW